MRTRKSRCSLITSRYIWGSFLSYIHILVTSLNISHLLGARWHTKIASSSVTQPSSSLNLLGHDSIISHDLLHPFLTSKVLASINPIRRLPKLIILKGKESLLKRSYYNVKSFTKDVWLGKSKRHLLYPVTNKANRSLYPVQIRGHHSLFTFIL